MRNTVKYISAALAFAAAVVLLQGCGAAVRKCVDPQVDIPQTIVPGEEADSLCLADLEWSEIFSDPLLKVLIEKTLENNRDMLTASARVRELERRHRIVRAEQFPEFGARGYLNQENYTYTDRPSALGQPRRHGRVPFLHRVAESHADDPRGRSRYGIL